MLALVGLHPTLHFYRSSPRAFVGERDVKDPRTRVGGLVAWGLGPTTARKSPHPFGREASPEPPGEREELSEQKILHIL